MQLLKLSSECIIWAEYIFMDTITYLPFTMSCLFQAAFLILLRNRSIVQLLEYVA